MKKLFIALMAIGLLISTNSFAAQIVTEVPDKYVDILAQAFGYQDQITTVNEAKQMVKVENPMPKQEFILNYFQSAIDATIQTKIFQERMKAVTETVKAEYNASKVSVKQEYLNEKNKPNTEPVTS